MGKSHRTSRKEDAQAFLYIAPLEEPPLPEDKLYEAGRHMAQAMKCLYSSTDDVVQEFVLAAWKEGKNRGAGLHNRQIQSGRKAARAYYRKRKNIVKRESTLVSSLETSADDEDCESSPEMMRYLQACTSLPGPDAGLRRKGALRLIHKTIAEMELRVAEAFVLRHLRDLPREIVMKRMGIGKTLLYQLLQEAEQVIRRKFQN